MTAVLVHHRLPEEARGALADVADLLDAFRARSGLRVGIDLMRGTPFQVDGVLFSLRYLPQMPDHLQVFIDFGEAPSDGTALRGLLESCHADLGSGSGYGVDPRTGRVVCCVCVALEGLDAISLERLLGNLAAAARRAAS